MPVPNYGNQARWSHEEANLESAESERKGAQNGEIGSPICLALLLPNNNEKIAEGLQDVHGAIEN